MMTCINNFRNFLVLGVLAGVVACGNNQDSNDNQPGDTGSAGNSAETLNINIAADPPQIANTMNMSGTNMSSTSGMAGMTEAVDADDISEPHLTEQGIFQVSITPALDPIPLNQMHNWTLHVETSAGDVVDDADITVTGGMPAHNHGMPTSPQVTRSMGNGDYLVEGVQFQMPGHWVITLNISANGNMDTVSLNLMLQP